MTEELTSRALLQTLKIEIESPNLKLTDEQLVRLISVSNQLLSNHLFFEPGYKAYSQSISDAKDYLEKALDSLSFAIDQVTELELHHQLGIRTKLYHRTGTILSADGTGDFGFLRLAKELKGALTDYSIELMYAYPQRQGRRKDNSWNWFIASLADHVESYDYPISVSKSRNTSFERLVTCILKNIAGIEIEEPHKRIKNALESRDRHRNS